MHIKKLYLCIAFIYISFGVIKSQDIAKKTNTLYAEIAGISGTPISIQYDRIINKKENYLVDVTMGFGYFQFSKNWNPIIGFPISLNFANGQFNHHFEFGIGLTYNSGMPQQKIEDFPAESEKAFWATLRLGYKYQKPEGGLFIRAGFTPLIKIKQYSVLAEETNFLPLLGLGIGYTF